MSSVKAFGPGFSRELATGAASIGAEIEWVCAVLALESGFDPKAANASGARGLWQRMPDQVRIKGEPLILPPGSACPPGCILRELREKGGLRGYKVWRLYAVSDPRQQLIDYFAFTRGMLDAFKARPIRSREALYCVNLAPARLGGGRYDPDTLLYPVGSSAYRQNARAFGLDPEATAGGLRMKHLAVGLDAAVERCRARYDVEVAAAYAALDDDDPPPAVA